MSEANTDRWALLFAAADVSHDMSDYARLVECEEEVAEAFARVSEASNVSISQLLRPAERPTGIGQVEVISLGLLAGMTGVANMLVRRHGAPAVVGGVSLGEYAALVTANSLSLEGGVKLIHARNVKGEEPEAVGFAMVPEGLDWGFYGRQEGFSISVDYGPIQQGFARFLMLSGLRERLEHAQAAGPVEIEVLDENMADEAHHSQWRSYALDTVSAFLETLPLGRPVEGTKVATTLPSPAYIVDGDDARAAILASEVEGLSVPTLIERFQSADITKVRAIGPFLSTLR